jgi:acyl-CoA dehydrogenase
MHLFGLVVLGYMWCRIAEAATARARLAGDVSGRMQAKLVTARFFRERMLPETAAHLARIRAGAAGVMELPAELF